MHSIPMSSTQYLIATEEMLQDFHCTICGCLLTVTPIRLIENHYVCGRCPGNGSRDLSLERFACRFQFPCRYAEEGCTLNLIWTEVDKHEENCGWKSTKCLITDCGWKGTKVALAQHVENMHASQFLSAKDLIKLSNVQVAKYFYFIGGETAFEIDIEICKKIITYRITMLWSKEDPSSYAYKITFLNDNFNLTLLHEAKMFGVPSHMNTKSIKYLTDKFDEIQVHIKIDVLDKINNSYVECTKCSSPVGKNLYVSKCGYSLCETCLCPNVCKC